MNAYKSIAYKSGLLVLAALAIFLAGSRFFRPETTPTNAKSLPVLVYDATAAMQKSVVLPSEVRAVSRNLVYDATAAMQKSVVLSNQVRPAPRNLPYDATGAMLEAIVFP